MLTAPLRDRVRNLVYCAQTGDLHPNMIDGEFVMRSRVLPGDEMQALTVNRQAGTERMWDNMHSKDSAHRRIDQHSPNSFPTFRA